MFELIQNAEDNSYTQAENVGDDLYLRFKIYEYKIVVESNNTYSNSYLCTKAKTCNILNESDCGTQK